MNTAIYESAMSLAELLIGTDPAPESLDGKLLYALTESIEVYEAEHYPIPEGLTPR